MNCPSCPGTMSIIANRNRRLMPVVWRRRRCLKCGKVVTTYETIEAVAQSPGNLIGKVDQALARVIGELAEVRSGLALTQQIHAEEGGDGDKHE